MYDRSGPKSVRGRIVRVKEDISASDLFKCGSLKEWYDEPEVELVDRAV